jgi:hypothetical protein
MFLWGCRGLVWWHQLQGLSVANPGGVATQHTAVGGATTESSTDEDLLD